MSDNAIPAWLRPDSTSSESNALRFFVKILMGQAAHVLPVSVISCTNAGQIEPAGTVDVMPLLNQLGADNTAVSQKPIYGLPYFRAHGGATAVILDPVAGDLGRVVCCDRDVSSVKKNQAISNPGSLRQFSKSDGMYFGGFMNGLMNGTPTQFIQFLTAAGGINIVTPQAFTVTASNFSIDVSGNVVAQGNITGKGGSGTVDLNHTHGGVQAGSAQTAPPTGGT
jgi:hypothetical protein